MWRKAKLSPAEGRMILRTSRSTSESLSDARSGPSGDTGRAERPPEHRAELQDLALRGLQEIEARQDGRLDRVGERRERVLDGRDIAQRVDALPDGLDDLAREEGVAFGAGHDTLDDLRGSRADHVADQLRDRVVAERLQRHGDVVPPASSPRRAPIEQLRTREGDHEHRRIAPRLHDELHEIEEAVARPVQVLEHQNERDRRAATSMAVRQAAKRAARSMTRLTGADRRGEKVCRTLGRFDAAV